MKRLLTGVLAILLLSPAEPGWGKARTVKIEIKGVTLATALVIADPEIVHKFSIWNGPGVAVNGQPVHLNPNKQAGMFIDWPKGIATERPTGLQRYEVTFHLEAQRGPNDSWSRYVVLYEFDASTAGGYMYLPGPGDTNPRMNSAIYHGVEGRWLYSSSAWEKLVRPLVESATAASAR